MSELIFAMLTVIMPILVGLFAKLIKDVTDETKYEKAIEAVMDAVYNVQQTYVDSLKEHGEFTKEAQANALDKAVTLAESYMSDAVRKYVEKTFADGWIENMVETVIGEMKHDK